MRDAEMVARFDATFGGYPRPEHFTDYKHCPECADHDKLLRSRARGDLQPQDVSNPGWDPICFVSAEGFRYWLPDLVRVSLMLPHRDYDWPFSNLLFHLTYEADRNRRLAALNSEERSLVAELLRHVKKTRPSQVRRCFLLKDLSDAIKLWGGAA